MKKKFEKLTKIQKRIEIAKDVLAQLESKKFIAETGVWVENQNGQPINFEKDEKDKQVSFKNKKCEVCALGACFVSAVTKFNTLKVKDLDILYGHYIPNYDSIMRYLSRYFTKRQLKMIEYTYENGDGAVLDEELNEKDLKDCDSFFDNIMITVNEDTDNTRLGLIMENIIANNGIFDPKKKPITLHVTPGFNIKKYLK